MKEIYVISYKATGRIKSSGRIDKELDALNLDGSTVTEKIAKRLLNTDLEVTYLPNGLLPDSNTQKIENNLIVPLSIEDVAKDDLIKEAVNLKLDLKSAIVWQFRMIQAIWSTGVSKGIWAASDIESTELKQKYVEWGQKLTRLEELGE